jgi:hypothetical protein
LLPLPQVEETAARSEQRRATAAACRAEIAAVKAEVAKGPTWSEEQLEVRRGLAAEVAELQHELELKQHDHIALSCDLDR